MSRSTVLVTLLICPFHALAKTPIVLPLERKVALTGPAAAPIPKAYYVGTIKVGKATEEMQVHFETGSGSLVLDSTRCSSLACIKHHRYTPDDASALNRHGSVVARGERATISVDYSEEGSANGVVVGDMIREKVCLGPPPSVCADFAMLAAENMTDEPFAELPIDGLVGLGMKGISISSQFNFMDRFSATTGMPSLFGLYVPRSGNTGMGEISLGGHNAARLDSDLSWVSVQQPEDGYWQVKVTSVRIGTKELELCAAGCLAIIDSSSSHISIPAEVLPSVMQDLKVEVPKGWLTSQELCKKAHGEDLQLVLENGKVLTLTAQDYLQQEGKACEPQFHPLHSKDRADIGERKEDSKSVIKGGVGLNTLILGEPLLRKYYTVFDSDSKRMGFGLAKEESTEEIILMQGKTQRKRARVAAEL